MKRILDGMLICILCAFGVQGSQWAEQKHSAGARYLSNPEFKPAYQSLLVLVVRGQSVNVNIVTDDDEEYQRLQDQIRTSYGRWFSNAVRIIKQQHREQEFQDVLPILQQGVSLNFTKVSNLAGVPTADLTIRPMSLQDIQQKIDNRNVNEGSISGAGVNFKNKEPMELIIPNDEFFFQNEESQKRFETLLDHELGHTLGLADHYKDKRGLMPHASQVWKSKGNVVLSESRSVMEAQSETSPGEPTEDDADGLINMIDSWTLYNLKQTQGVYWKEKVSKRISKGWDSLRRDEVSGSSAERYRWGTTEGMSASVPNSHEEYQQMIERRKTEAAAYRKSLGF